MYTNQPDSLLGKVSHHIKTFRSS